ncbi:beta-galactosidase [Butyribacter sp.]|uniref:beta-galactosidase n=1 Tax=Butyribacter sp. TaxID=2822465 RepID=UPI002A997B75|nr:beta-galactosidase [Butyribacter sp.]
MNNKIFFPQVNGILHGSDYNPDQWLDRPDILEKDIELMKKAKMTSMSLGIFSWSAYEPTEGEFHMDWLKDIMDKLYENGIYTILATPSGARPAWLDEKYPECMRVGADDHRAHHGVRHNHCMSSPKFREKTGIIINKIIDTVGKHPGLAMWHLSNEFGGECFCPLCKKKFQDYLANKFDNDINKLNKAWWTGFWSHTYNDFSQIEPPYLNGEFSVMGLNLEWKRFTTWNTTDYMKSEIDIIRKRTPNIPITTNFMQLFPGLDYRVMAKELDVISWDSYPVFHNNYETMADTMAHNSFDHAVMRSLKKNQPFMLMECAPGLVNWHEYNKLKRPGVHKLFSTQAVACGSDTVQYFQWRKSRGSFEQYHGAVVDHIGTDDTRVFKEVAEVGAMLDSLSNVKGTIVKPKAALIFDWDNMWAIDNMRGLSDKTKNYAKTCIQIYHEFLKLGIDMNVVASDDNLDDYNVVIAPMLYMLRPGASDNLKAFVKRGGQLLATYLTGYVDDNALCYLGGFPGDGLSELFGVISEEIDTYYDSDENSATFTDGHKAIIHDYAEILRVSDTDILAKYDKDFYAGTPAITCKNFGKGKAYYVGARIDMDSMSGLFKTMLKETNTTYLTLPAGIEYHKREDESGKTIEFYLNVTENEITFNMTDNTQVTLKPYGVKIV